MLSVKDFIYKILFNTLNCGASGLMIEVSGVCNAQCKYCCRATGNHVSTVPYMPVEKFAAILAHLRKIGMLQRWKGTVAIWTWSEPTLHPEINKILGVLGNYRLRANISSNFIAPWAITPENYKNISDVSFSLCSLKKDRYKKIYGADLAQTLEHFKEFLEIRKTRNPRIRVHINWLQYKFTYDELESARAYFTTLVGQDVDFADDYYAMVKDLQACLSYCRSGGKDLEGYDLEEAKRDIDFDVINRTLAKPFPHTTPSSCPFAYGTVVNEEGQLRMCCMMSSKNKEHSMGDILTLTKKEIMHRKQSGAICRECLQYHIPSIFHSGSKDALPEK
ncbi:MAG: radical SAM protein [Holosporales bacterium]|jgi:pyruvate-formate lyase-activating enzyme|nr:radical SAM protein [Holosporales bacterium]